MLPASTCRPPRSDRPPEPLERGALCGAEPLPGRLGRHAGTVQVVLLPHRAREESLLPQVARAAAPHVAVWRVAAMASPAISLFRPFSPKNPYSARQSDPLRSPGAPPRSTDAAKQHPQRFRRTRNHDQVHMIAHQAVRQNLHAGGCHLRPQQTQIQLVISDGEKDPLAVGSALRDMVSESGIHAPGISRHRNTSAPPGPKFSPGTHAPSRIADFHRCRFRLPRASPPFRGLPAIALFPGRVRPPKRSKPLSVTAVVRTFAQSPQPLTAIPPRPRPSRVVQ
jgi:hypothetical protein